MFILINTVLRLFVDTPVTLVCAMTFSMYDMFIHIISAYVMTFDTQSNRPAFGNSLCALKSGK